VRKEADDPLAYVVNRFFNVTAYRRHFNASTGQWWGGIQNATWPTHNFTVVGTRSPLETSRNGGGSTLALTQTRAGAVRISHTA
jgi:hypothetical protein